MVFTAGAPGSGKTYTLHKIFGLDRVDMLDLDAVMPRHPDYDPCRPEALYTQPDAYTWADAQVEERFQSILRKPYIDLSVGDEPTRAGSTARFVCVDGTGTHVDRQKRRMSEAKRAGFLIVNLHVRVSLETCLKRNKARRRTVPENILEGYIDRLEAAVAELARNGGWPARWVQMRACVGAYRVGWTLAGDCTSPRLRAAERGACGNAGCIVRSLRGDGPARNLTSARPSPPAARPAARCRRPSSRLNLTWACSTSPSSGECRGRGPGWHCAPQGRRR